MRQKNRPLKEPAERLSRTSDGDAQALFGRGEDPDRAGRSPWLGQHCRAVPAARGSRRTCTIVGSAVVTPASCRIRIVRGHRDPPRDCGTMAPGAGWLRAA